MQVCIVEGGKIEWHGLRTDVKGHRILIVQLLRKSDVVRYEVSGFGNRLARAWEKDIGCLVVALNAEEMRIIWQSRKQTDKGDALKIAKYLWGTSGEERCRCRARQRKGFVLTSR
jgi:hypothetical protein